MYFPYLRGKQFEIIALREMADIISGSSQVPIVEPVRRSSSALQRLSDVSALISSKGGEIIIIANPKVGELASNNAALVTTINGVFSQAQNLIVGIIVDNNTSVNLIQNAITQYGLHRIAFIHQTMSPVVNLPVISAGAAYHVFVSGRMGSTYVNSFSGGAKVLLNDGFHQHNNADYVPDEFYSNLHLTYAANGYDGFGDFLTIGDYYRDGGGAAYAVALHLTYFQLPPAVADMHIKHFISISNSTSKNPGGKFAEALSSLMNHLNSANCVIQNTRGVDAYRVLHSQQRYPGLGVPKKLSIMHHIEIMANRFP